MYRESPLAALLLLLTSTVDAAAVPILRRGGLQLASNLVPATPFSAPSPLEVTSNYATLRRTGGNSKHLPMLRALQQQDGIKGVFSIATGNGSTPLVPALGGEEFLVGMEWAGTSVLGIFDSGSSDTWLIQGGFNCLDASRNKQPEATCNFGPPFNGTFNEGSIANQNFKIAYGDGEFVNGVLGYEDITIAGVTVSKQEAALGTSAYWNGDGVASGLIGFAYPNLTSAFPGTDPNQDKTPNHYDPWFTSAYKQGLISPMFSLAIERGTAGGYLALGGLPPVTFDQTFTSTPIQVLSIAPQLGVSFYTITVDSYDYAGTNSTSSQAIVDSGTTLIYAPSDVAKAANAAFSPPAKLLQNQGAYFVDCNAKVPAFSVKIAGTDFAVDAADLIYKDAVDSATGLCLTGIQDGGSGPYILGDVFLQNVIAVFDVGAAQMRFAPHKY